MIPGFHGHKLQEVNSSLVSAAALPSGLYHHKTRDGWIPVPDGDWFKGKNIKSKREDDWFKDVFPKDKKSSHPCIRTRDDTIKSLRELTAV